MHLSEAQDNQWRRVSESLHAQKYQYKVLFKRLPLIRTDYTSLRDKFQLQRLEISKIATRMTGGTPSLDYDARNYSPRHSLTYPYGALMVWTLFVWTLIVGTHFGWSLLAGKPLLHCDLR